MEETRQTHRPLVLTALILAMFMAAIEGTIVATALPTIVGDLAGFSLFSWVFSIFLLTQAASIPIYGKLADLYGRKPVFFFGTGLFLIGSLLCGLSQSMHALIIFRGIQGLGAGAVQPISTTIVGDLYDLKERARVQGYLASVWGISSVVGPFSGGLIVTYIGWPWIFYLNLPLGAAALCLLARYFHENIERRQHRIDYVGSGLLFVGVSAFVAFLTQGGVAWAWSSLPSTGLLVLSMAGVIAFLLQEYKASEPILPLPLLRRKVMAVGNIGAFLTGALTLGTSSFIPTFVQGVLGYSATIAGFSLATMSIGWPMASTLSGHIMIRYGYRRTALAGGLFTVVAGLVFLQLGADSTPWQVAAGSFLMGAGLGLTTTTYIIAIQNSVPWQERGVATGSNMFGRILGSTIGVAILGSILNSRLAAYLEAHGTHSLQQLGADAGNVLLDPVKRGMLAPRELSVLREGFVSAIHIAFASLVFIGIFVILAAWFLPARARSKSGSMKED